MTTTSEPIIILGMPPEIWSVLAIGAVGLFWKWVFGVPPREYSDDERFEGKHLELSEDDATNPRLDGKVTEAILRHHRTQQR